MGFVRAWIEAGASFMLGGNWALEDDAAMNTGIWFMEDHIKYGKPAAIALRDVRRRLQIAGASPLQWGAFSICGDPYRLA